MTRDAHEQSTLENRAVSLADRLAAVYARGAAEAVSDHATDEQRSARVEAFLRNEQRLIADLRSERMRVSLVAAMVGLVAFAGLGLLASRFTVIGSATLVATATGGVVLYATRSMMSGHQQRVRFVLLAWAVMVYLAVVTANARMASDGEAYMRLFWQSAALVPIRSRW